MLGAVLAEVAEAEERTNTRVEALEQLTAGLKTSLEHTQSQLEGSEPTAAAAAAAVGGVVPRESQQIWPADICVIAPGPCTRAMICWYLCVF